MSKLRDFGLPAIGGGAAALLQSRKTRADREEEVVLEDRAAPREVVPPAEPQNFVRPVIAASPVSQPSPTSPRGGRPKGPPSKRMHLSIEEGLANYLNRAWRTHERADGSLAGGPADLVEDLLAEHRHRHAPSK